jgi:hypothetical protein
MTIEKVENTENTIDIFKNDVDMYIKLFCEENNIDDLCSISQNRFSALLYYLYLHVFKDNLKSKNQYNNGLFGDTTYNAYDIDLLCDIVDLYCFISDQYDKIISVQGFCKMTGISQNTLYEWGNGNRCTKVSSRSSEIFKRLTAERERTLSDRLASGVKNPVGVLGCLNHWHNWAGVGNMEERKPQQISLSDVRKQAVELSDNSGGDRLQIAENGNNKLSDN